MVTPPLTIAVASGKGGTGKTTVSLALAECAREPCLLLDCDVEEPNDALFLFPGAEPEAEREAYIPVPAIDADACDSCGECSRFCRFNALAILGKAMAFPELCHGCGGCALVCPRKAIRETPKPIGRVRSWSRGSLTLVEGELNVGCALSPPLIREVRSEALSPGRVGEKIVIVDAPPGSSCPMANAVKGSDALLLVTEPTPFGLNDLKLARECARSLGLPCAVVVNRDGEGSDELDAYCASEGLPILARIAEDRRIAEAGARGLGLLEAAPEYRSAMDAVFRKAVELAGGRP